MHRLTHKDEGSALVPVIGIAAILFIVAMLVASLTASSLATTSSTRSEVRANSAAESGISFALEAISGGCTPSTVSGESRTSSDPYFRYVVTTQNASGNWVKGCPSSITAPAQIISTGFATQAGFESGQGTSKSVAVTLAAGKNIDPSPTPVVGNPSFYSYGSIDLGGGAKILPFDSTSPADVHVAEGDAVCDGGTETTGTRNWIISKGSFKASGSCRITGDVWAAGDAVIEGGAKIAGKLVANNVTFTGGARIDKGVFARGNFTSNVWATFTADFLVKGNANITGTTIDGNLSVGGNLTGEQAKVTGTTEVGGSATVTSPQLAKGMTVAGDTVFNGQPLVQGGLTVGGSLTVPSGSKISDRVTVSKDLTTTGYSAYDEVITGPTLVGGALTSRSGLIGGDVSVKGKATFNYDGSKVRGNLVAADGDLNTAKHVTTGSVKIPYTGSFPSIPNINLPAVTIPDQPKVQPWIDVPYNVTDWPNYTPLTLSGNCTFEVFNNAISQARSDLLIDARACSNTISFSDNQKITLNHNLAVFGKRFNLTGAGGFNSSQNANLFLVNEDAKADNLPTCSGQSFSLSGGFTIDSKIVLSIYSPCRIEFTSGNAFTGQIYSDGAKLNGGLTLTYKYLPLPKIDQAYHNGDGGDSGNGSGTQPGSVTERSVLTYKDSAVSTHSFGVGP